MQRITRQAWPGAIVLTLVLLAGCNTSTPATQDSQPTSGLQAENPTTALPTAAAVLPTTAQQAPTTAQQAPTTAQQAPTTASQRPTTTGSGEEVPEVTFTGQEYSFAGPDSIPGGWTRVTFENEGELPHDLMLFRMEEGRTIDDVMGELESAGPPEWITILTQLTAQPGESAFAIVELEPGNYGMLSFGEQTEGPPDAAQGMVKELTVTAATADQVALPEADAAVEMVDYAYIVSELPAGTSLVELSNTGEEPHEAVIFQLNEGQSIEDVQALLDQPGATDEQFAEVASFVSVMLASPGQTMYGEVDLEPGNYAFVCFIPSPENQGLPHYELGMIQEVVVE